MSLTLTLFAICLSFSSPPLHPCRFIRPLFTNFLSRSLVFYLLTVMSKIGEIIVDMDNNDNMENPDVPAEEPPILHTKKFWIGSGNIIGKGVIQDFFTCAGALPTMSGSILHKTSSLAYAIALLIVELEDNFYICILLYKGFS